MPICETRCRASNTQNATSGSRGILVAGTHVSCCGYLGLTQGFLQLAILLQGFVTALSRPGRLLREIVFWPVIFKSCERAARFGDQILGHEAERALLSLSIPPIRAYDIGSLLARHRTARLLSYLLPSHACRVNDLRAENADTLTAADRPESASAAAGASAARDTRVTLQGTVPSSDAGDRITKVALRSCGMEDALVLLFGHEADLPSLDAYVISLKV